MTQNRILGIGRRYFLTCSNKQREGIYLLGVLLINIYVGRKKLSEKDVEHWRFIVKCLYSTILFDIRIINNWEDKYIKTCDYISEIDSDIKTGVIPFIILSTCRDTLSSCNEYQIKQIIQLYKELAQTLTVMIKGGDKGMLYYGGLYSIERKFAELGLYNLDNL